MMLGDFGTYEQMEEVCNKFGVFMIKGDFLFLLAEVSFAKKYEYFFSVQVQDDKSFTVV